MKSGNHSMRAVFVILLSAATSAWTAAPMAVVKASSGSVKAVLAKGQERQVKAADLLNQGVRLETGLDSKATLRLQGDQSSVDMRPQTTLKLRLVRRDGKVVRKLIVDRGNIAVNFRRKGEGGLVENAQTMARLKSARFSFTSDDQATATLVVLDGEITVMNRPKDQTALVHGGQKAVSDLNGIRVTDATDSELEGVGMRENNLEIDFHNPETDEVSTLEVDYETQY